MPPDSGEALQKVGSALSRCPLCAEPDSFEMIRRDTVLACRTCKARWASPQFRGDEPLIYLELAKPGKRRIGKRIGLGLRGRKTIRYWRELHDDPRPAEAEREVRALLKTLAGHFRKQDFGPQFRDALQAVADLSPLAQAEFEGIAEGVDGAGINSVALWAITRAGNERWIEVLGRQMEDPDEKKREKAVDTTMLLTGKTGNRALVPKVIERLAEDESPLVRRTAAGTLHLAGSDPAVVAALQAALDDHDSPSQPIMTGSLTAFLVAAAKSGPETTVANTARESLRRIHKKKPS